MNTRYSSHDLPPDLTLPPNNLHLEAKRGDILNRIAYGLLTTRQKHQLFSTPHHPVTYPTVESFRNDLEATLYDLPSVLSSTQSVSTAAVRTLCHETLANYPTRFAEARLRCALFDLADESRCRGRDDLLVPTAEKTALADGLSPVFGVNDSAQFTAFVNQLNHRASLSDITGPCEGGVLTIAISYKHELHPTQKLSPAHLREIAVAVPALAAELRCERYQIWVDRILSAKNRPDDRSWWKRGLGPFLQLPVLYVSGTDRSDDALIREMNTMWINIERVAAYIGRGMVSYGTRFDRARLPVHGINFTNAGISSFDWWLCSDDQHDLESNFKALLLAIGSTSMLQRETYFDQDRDQLLQEARRTFCDSKEVLTTRAVTNYIMRDDVLWFNSEEPTWLGEREWCAGFVDEETSDHSKTLLSSAEPFGAASNVEFRSFEILDENQADEVTWVVICPKSLDPVIALAVQIIGRSAGLRGLVVIDSPLEFLALSATGLRGIDRIEANLPTLIEMLRNSAIASPDAKVCSVFALRCDSDILTKELL